MDDIHLLIAQYGLLLVFANVLIGQFGAPIPAFPTLIVAGGLARSGDLSLATVFALDVGVRHRRRHSVRGWSAVRSSGVEGNLQNLSRSGRVRPAKRDNV